MALGRQTGEFSFKGISSTYIPGPDNAVTTQINFEGSQSGDQPGVVQGTLTVAGAGDKSGTWTWCGVGFLENGDSVTAKGQGKWETVGPHSWRLRGLINASDGVTAAVEGEGDLASRSLSGKLFEWN